MASEAYTMSRIAGSFSKGDGDAVGLNARYYTDYVKDVSTKSGVSPDTGTRYLGDYLTFRVGDRGYELGVEARSPSYVQLSDSRGAFLGRERVDDGALNRKIKEHIVKLVESYNRRTRR